MGRKSPGVVIRKSPTNGRGLFANRDLRPGEKVLDWESNCNQGVFLNHSCAANCILEEKSKDPYKYWDDVLLVGTRGIRKGEEITLDYRRTKWRQLWRQTIKKNCGCFLCRSKAA